jgi:DNA-directed RNA polymerase specialized sigma24 family protein
VRRKDPEPDHLMSELKRKQFDAVASYLKKEGARGREEELATNAMSKVWRYVERHPFITLEHAKRILWRAARQELADYLRGFWARRFKPLGPEYLGMLPWSGGLSDELLDQEMLELLDFDLRRISDGEELLQRFQGDSWCEIAFRLGTSQPTARTRLAKAFAQLTIWMADRRHGDTLLRELGRLYGQAETIARLWVAGAKPVAISTDLNISLAEAQRLYKGVIAFFKMQL